jgi:hypothetical protein
MSSNATREEAERQFASQVGNYGVCVIDGSHIGPYPGQHCAALVESISRRLVTELAYDNDYDFVTTTDGALLLFSGVKKMLAAGCAFSPWEIGEISGGEVSEVTERFSKYDGYEEVSKALNLIFDGE